MRVRLLGPMEVDSGSARPGPRDRVVLAALAVHPGHSLDSAALAEALWPDGPPASRVKIVQGCVSRLRSVLGPAAIETTTRGYRLDPVRVGLDRDEFERLADEAREQVATGAPERAVVLFERALDLWRGRPFDELDEWQPAQLEAMRLTELRLAVEEDLLQALLDSGHHQRVAAKGTVLVGEEPWRERRWALLALAQYRCGRQADALASIRTARRALGRELGLDPGSDLASLEQAILAQDESLTVDHEALTAARFCPWPGLASYDTEDHDAFFGRDGDVETCVRRLDESPLLALVGPSGCGKSSLMRAGVVAALRRAGRSVVLFTPGPDPVAAMTAARASVSGDPVLCVDQFEELFTSRLGAESRRAWLRELAAYAEERSAVVLTVRSDYVSECSTEPTFAGLVERGLHLVGPLGETALRAVVEGPARQAGLRLEHGLVDLLLRDAADQPGALPLLSHALAETWRRREDTLLTVDGYRASGGISGAVAASADRLCDSLSDSGRGQLRWLMLRMGSLADHGEPVRTPVPREVATDEPERARVVDLLVRARLVTSTGGDLELAHEALIRAWPRLRAWLEEDRAGQRLWRHLARSAAEWDLLGRPDTELYQGVRLEAALDWAGREGSQPTRLEQEFLDASHAQAVADREALEQQARHERSQNRRLRSLLAGVAVLLACALVAALIALDRGRTAAAERDAARDARTLALHESLVSRSLSLRGTNRSVAALLAVEAWRARRDPLAESALLGTFTDAPGFLGYRRTPYDVIQGAPVPHSSQAVIGSGNRLRVLDLGTGELGPEFDSPIPDNADQQVLRVSGDGRRVAQLLFDPAQLDHCGFPEQLARDNGRHCTLLTVFDIARRKPVFGPVSTPFSGGDLAIDRTGRTVAVAGGFDSDVVTYDVDHGSRLGVLAGPPRPEEAENWRDTGSVAFDGAGRLFAGTLSGPIRQVDPRTLEVVRSYPAPPMSTHNFLTVTPRGLIVATGDDFVLAMRAGSGKELWRVDLRDDPDVWPCTAATVAPSMGRLYCGSLFGEIEERDLRNGQLTGVRRDPQLGEVGDLAVAHGNELVAFSKGYYRWRLDGTGPVARMVASGVTTNAGYDPSGRLIDLVPVGRSAPHRVIDVSSGASLSRIRGEAETIWAGGRVLALFADGRVRLLEAGSDRARRPRDPAVAGAEWIYPGSDPEYAWAVVARRSGVRLAEFAVDSGSLTGRDVRIPGYPGQVRSTDGGRVLFVTYVLPFSHLSYDDRDRTRAALFDVDGDQGLSIPAGEGAVSGARRGIGRIVVADYYGSLREVDPATMRTTAVLPGSMGGLQWLTFSDDGTRLLATGRNNAAQLYDSSRWTRIGTIPAEAEGEVREAFLRPDGRAVVANGRFGVVEWDLDPDRMAAAACGLAGRNLTRAEWATYMGEEPFRRTCPQFPVGA